MGNNVKIIICTRNGKRVNSLFLRPNAIRFRKLVNKQL